MSPYWRRAWYWARENTRTYTAPKAVPSVAVTALQYFSSSSNDGSRTATALFTIVGVYLILWTLEFGWNLIARAPVALNNEHLAQVDAALRTQREAEIEIRRLIAENLDLRHAPKTPAQKVLFDQASEGLQRLDPAERRLLVSLLRHEEIRHEQLKQQLMDCGFSDQSWAKAIEKAKAAHLIEAIPPGPTRQYNAFRVNPNYKEPLLELLNPDL